MPRPRTVSEEDALEHALRLFWEKGYDRTSVSDLGAAIGVGPSSIYNAFGSKASLFRRALKHYMTTHAGFVPGLVEGVGQQGVGETLRELLHQAVRLYTKRGLPNGCAMLQGGGSGGCDDSEGGVIAKEFRGELELALRSIFDGATAREKLAESPRLLAKFILGVMRGLSQLAVDGTSRQELTKIADHAVRSCLLPTRRDA